MSPVLKFVAFLSIKASLVLDVLSVLHRWASDRGVCAVKTGYSIVMVLTIILLALVLTPVHGDIQSIDSCTASFSSISPMVILQSGATGNASILTNGTSAFVLVSAAGEQSADVLNVVNQVTAVWNVSLQVYNSSNIARLSSGMVSFDDGTLSNQIVIINGYITQSQGQPYTLPAGAGSTIYISIDNLIANTTGTSYLYVCLQTVPTYSSPFNVLQITFQVT